MNSILITRKTLNNGVEIPMMGFGTWMMTDEQAAEAVCAAIKAGYRMIDTAAFYNCERGVGEGIRAGLKETGLQRSDLFVTTKVWPTDLYEGTIEPALESSLKRLNLDYLDLWLMHWPVKYVESWNTMIKLYTAGAARAIGVSNFRVRHLMTLLDNTDLIPAMLQLECNPLLSQYEVRALCAYKGIAVSGWQSLGSGPRGEVLSNEVILALAQKHGKTPAQIALRWAYQQDVVTIPKTVTPGRMLENADIMDFELDAEDLRQIGELRQLARYDTETADVPDRISAMMHNGVRFKQDGYAGNLTKDFFAKK